jgi:hypothetical protein
VSIKHTPLPANLNASLPAIRSALIDYLNLEENTEFGSGTLNFAAHLTFDDREGFIVFEYISEEEPALAFLQYPIGGNWNDGCTVCWPRTPDQTIEWSILEYLEYNPLDDA